MTLPIEIAQLPTLDTVQSTTRLLVQNGVTGTPYQQTTVGKVFLDLVDEIGTGTIVAGDVVISGGTADLDLLIAAEGTITDATIIGGTGTFATGSISTLTVAGTLTAGTIAATTINAGTVDISSGKATLATAVVTTGTVGTLSSTTGTIATLNAGTITIGTGTGTLTALNVTGTAALQTLTADSGTITALSAPTLAVSGTATVGHVSATSVTASGAIVGASGTITTVNAGTVAVAGKVSAATGTITDLATGTVSVSGTATISNIAGTAINAGTITSSGAVSGATGTFTTGTIPTLGVSGTATIGHVIGTTGTITTGTVGTLTSTAGTIGTLTANAGTVTLGKATLTDAVVTTGTVGTLTANSGTVTLDKAAITDLAATTLSASGKATLATAVVTTGTVGTLTSTKATLTEANIAGTDHQPLSLSPGWSIQWQDSTGYTAAGITDDGALKAATANIGDATFVGPSLSPGWSLQWSDAAGYAAGGIADDGSLVFDTATIADVKYKPRSLNPGWSRIWMDDNGYIAAGITDAGVLTIGQSDTIRTVIGGDGTMTAVSDFLPGVVAEVADSAGYVSQVIGQDGRTRFTPRTNVIARAARNIVRPTNLHSYTPPRTGTDGSVTTNSTIATLWTLDLDFDYIRIVLGQQSANAMTAKACIAATAAANDGVNPLDEAGAPGTWVDVTFNNAGSPDFEPWNQNSGATGTIVQNTSSEPQVWGLTYSDWMQVSSLPRTDGSPYPLVMIRVHLTGTPAATDMASTNLFGLTPTTSNFGRTWAAYLVSGDFVGTKSGYTNSGTSYGDRWAPLFIQTYSRKLGYQLWGCGDSNMAGTGSANGMMGFYKRSALRVGRNFPVIYSNFNQPGSSPNIYMSNVENIIDAVKPSAVVIFPFSYNTAATMANLNTNWARALNMAHRISSYGGEPILVGYPPRDSATAGEDAVRRLGLERLAYAAASGFRTVDPNIYVGTDDVPAQWVTGMSEDGVHFSNLGHAVTADLLTVQLAEAFGE